MMRCMLCRKKVDRLSEHQLCEECEKKFDFNQGEPYLPEEEEGSAKTQLKRILVTSGCAVALILFFIWAIPLLMSLFNVWPS
jgi:hypothetical protein